MHIGQLWMQLAEDEDLKFHKVKGDESPADFGMKNLTRVKIDELLEKVYLSEDAGRAEVILKI